MEEKEITYSIELADGTLLENLIKNGDNFVSCDEVQKELFEENCSPVLIYGTDGSKELHENIELVQIQKHEKEYWIVLTDISSEKMEKIKMQSDIEYLAMMSGVEL